MTNNNNYDLSKYVNNSRLRGMIGLYFCNVSPYTFDDIKKSIDYCIEKYDDEGNYINTIFNNLNKGIHYYQYDNCRINKVIDYILSYNPKIDYDAFHFGCLVGKFKLIELAFNSGIKGDKIDKQRHPLLYIIDSCSTDEEIIRIIDLFCKNGLDIIKFAQTEKFYTSAKLNIIKYIIEKTDNIKQLYLHKICSSLKIMLFKIIKFKAFKDLVEYMIKKMIDYYGSVNIEDNNGQTPLNILYGSYEKSINIDSIYNEEKWYKYLIGQLVIYGSHTNISVVDFYGYMDNLNLYYRFEDMIEHVKVPRKEAIEFVRSVSEYLLPDIANVVFDYSYEFDENEHNSLANMI